MLPAPEPRPRVGVVLAAGEARRMAPVTQGRSKMLLAVGGMPLVERAVRVLLAAGLERVIVVVGYQGDAVARTALAVDSSRVEIVRAERWQAGNGASLAAAAEPLAGERLFALVCADVVLPQGALDGLLRVHQPAVLVDRSPPVEAWTEGTRVREAGGRAISLSRDLPDPAIDCGAFVFGPEIFE